MADNGIAPAHMAAGTATATCVPFDRWPAIDQALWEAGCLVGDPFDDPTYGGGLASASRCKAMKGHGRALAFLAERGWLDPNQHPFDRIAKQTRRAAYFAHLQQSGNAPYTIKGRFDELHMAMKIMAPDRDIACLRRLGGRTIRSLLHLTTRHLFVPDGGVMFEWGIDLMKSSDSIANATTRCLQYRDGLLIAVLAACGRRLRATGALRLGAEVTKRGDVYHIDLKPELGKVRKRETFDLPNELSPWIDRYIAEIRATLVSGPGRSNRGRAGRQPHTYFWVTQDGAKLSEKSIQSILCLRSKARFDVAFGPHRARHVIVTTITLRRPGQPGLAAAVIGASKQTVDLHYDRSGQVLAAETFIKLRERQQRAAIEAGERRERLGRRSRSGLE